MYYTQPDDFPIPGVERGASSAQLPFPPQRKRRQCETNFSNFSFSFLCFSVAEKSSLDDTYKWLVGRDAPTLSDIPELLPRGNDGKVLLGLLDTVYLSCYAFAMFFMGRIAERVSKRIFLFIGCV